MFQFRVSIKRPEKPFYDLGLKSFNVPPRANEYVEFDDPTGMNQMYRVWAVVHPLSASDGAGRLILEPAGTEIELAQSFE